MFPLLYVYEKQNNNNNNNDDGDDKDEEKNAYKEVGGSNFFMTCPPTPFGQGRNLPIKFGANFPIVTNNEEKNRWRKLSAGRTQNESHKIATGSWVIAGLGQGKIRKNIPGGQLPARLSHS